MDKDVDIVVDIDAKLVWREPPKNTEEAMHREQARIRVSAAANELRDIVGALAIKLAKRHAD